MFNSPISLKDRTTLITGAAQGIGRQIAQYCAAEGAHCILHDTPENGNTLSLYAVQLFKIYGVKVDIILKDLTDNNAPRYIHDCVFEKIARLDILINNAGVISYGNFHQTPLDTLTNLVTINASTYMSLMRLFIPGMVKNNFGRVLNVSSVSAFQPSVYQSAYGATKSFIQSLSEAVRQELKGTGVTVCTICPPFTNTGLINNSQFPKKLWWYSFSPVASVDTIARHSIRCLKKGMPVYVPGVLNYLTHLFFPRFFPRNFVSALSAIIMRPRG